MKLISFSLWGNNPKYTIGAIKNAELASLIYPEWKCRFYCANDVPNQIIFKLEEFKNTEIVHTNKQGNWKFATERFLAIDDEVEIVIFRDTDSRLNLREKEAVCEWINTNKILHVMKDHPYHGGYPILAGMWGLKKDLLCIKDLLNKFNHKESYHYDQVFLKEYIWDMYKENCIIHDEFFLKNPFPTKRKDNHYVGKPFEYNEEPSLPNAELENFGIYCG